MQTEKVAQHIVHWLKEYALKTQVKGFVVGISGGIDSAVTSILCAQTGLPTLCVEMPIHQHPTQVDLAQQHISDLKNRFANLIDKRVDLSESFDTFSKNLPKGESDDLLSLTLANTRARLRMTTLYYFSGIHSYLVAGTGNKIEDFGVGFYTKYGDGGVDLSPIADLLKSEVYALGRYLGVSQSILSAAPTDGLFGDSRNDETQLGASYDELEWAMKMHSENKTAADFSGRNLEVFQIYSRLNRVNQHKMNPIPVCEIPENLRA